MKIVPSADAGALHYVLDDGRIIKTLKLGEHISDTAQKANTVFAAVYHENKIVKVENECIVSQVYSKYFPQRIIVGDDVFALFTDGEYCFLEKFDTGLKREGVLKILFDFYSLDFLENRILLSGETYVYLLDENLKIIRLFIK